ncbi:MAG: serine hydrolase [Bacteroidota bacterium]
MFTSTSSNIVWTCAIFCLLLGAINPPSILAQESSPAVADSAETAKKLAHFLQLADSIREAALIPGVGIAIVYKNEVIFTGGLGYRDLAQKLPITASTLFSIGSNTKAFTGVIAAQLVDEGLLEWETPLIHYIPELKLKEDYVTRHVTIADALNHSTGLGRHDDIWKYNNLSREEILAALADLDFSSSFRNSFNYNNLMYVVAGIAQERVTAQSWESLVEERILKPLDMHNSFAYQAEFINAPERALGYQEDGVTIAPPVDLSGIAPAGSISSTPKDIANWLHVLVNNGQHKGAAFLSESEYNYMLRPHSKLSIRNGDELWFYYTGLGGWEKDGKRVVGADGAIDGMNSRTVMRLDEGFGIFIMTNKVSEYKRLIAEYAENIFMEDNYERNHEFENALYNLVDFNAFQRILLEEGQDQALAFYRTLAHKNFEGEMNALGYALMRENMFELALFVLELNTQEHPQSSNAFDSLGECYFLMEKYALSLKNYRKSLELDRSNGNAKMMIERIEKP